MAGEEKHAWTVRVTSSGEEEATAFARKHRFVIGAPVTFDEADPRVSALEYVIGALGADLVNGLMALARKRRIPIDQAEAVIHGQLEDALAFVGAIGASGQPKLEEMRAKVYVSSPADEATVLALWEDMLARSPLVRTLQPVVRLALELKVLP